MTSTSRSNSGRRRRFALFVLFARFENDRIALRRFRLEAFGASGRFTTWLRRSRRGPQLHQKGWHGSSNLGQCQNRAARLPRSIDALNQGTCQHQLVVCARDDVRPTFRLRWGTQPWHVPEQHLLVQAVAMLMRVAQAIGRANLGQGCRLVAFPDKPTDLGVTPTFLAPWRMTWITLTSIQRAVRRCNCFQQCTSIRLPLASVPSQLASGSPWVLASLH